jgi:uncharacterized LabA/DUF88 family protein
MQRQATDILDRLGSSGLTRALSDTLDSARLVRLAGTCGLTYPGSRTASQKKEKILEDLVSKATKDSTALRSVLLVLRKENSSIQKKFSRLSASDRLERLEDQDFLASNGNLGRHLFLLASGTDDLDPANIRQKLCSRVAAEGNGKPPSGSRKKVPAKKNAVPASPEKELAKLQKRSQAQEKKVRYLEGQISRSREVAKGLKRDLIERRGELAESRMLVERLRRDAAEQARASAGSNGTGAEPKADQLQELAKAVRSLTRVARNKSGDDKLLHTKLAELQDGRTLLAALQRETAGVRRDRRKDHKTHNQKLDEVLTEFRALRKLVEATVPPPGKARKKGQLPRVGIFVDVQNMYYAARQLKGRLDFDALIQTAVAERRLILAQAFVVESKEIDQSSFIARLEKRSIKVHRKNLTVRTDGSMKGDWDMEMALAILDAAPMLDVVVLVSGDGDFTSLVNRVKAMGPKVEVISFPRNTAKSLIEAADHFSPLDRNFMIRSEKPATRV